MSKENEEDVSGINDIFDDNKDNINKFPKTDETSLSDSETIGDQEENESGARYYPGSEWNIGKRWWTR